MARHHRIVQKDDHIDTALFDLRTDLLNTAEMAGMILLYLDRRGFLDQSPRRCCSTDVIFCQDTAISDAEILHQLLFGIMSDQCYFKTQRYLPSTTSLYTETTMERSVCIRTLITNPIPT